MKQIFLTLKIVQVKIISSFTYHVDYNLYEYYEQCILDASGVDLKEDNFMVGVILAAKAITQSIFNCFIGLTQHKLQ